MAGSAASVDAFKSGTTSTTSARDVMERILSANPAKFEILSGVHDTAAAMQFRIGARAVSVPGQSR